MRKFEVMTALGSHSINAASVEIVGGAVHLSESGRVVAAFSSYQWVKEVIEETPPVVGEAPAEPPVEA